MMEIAALVAHVDLSSIDAELAQIAAERARDHEARKRGEAELAECNQKLGVIARERRGLDVADALRDGVDVLAASASEDALKERRIALGAGLQELDRAESARHLREQNLRNDARGLVGKAVSQAVDQILGEAQAAAQTLNALYVKAKALSDAAPSYGIETLVGTLREAAYALATEKLLPSFPATLDVDDRTIAELKALAPFLTTIKGRVPTQVPPPVSFKIFRA